jgi:hypothetical protein
VANHSEGVIALGNTPEALTDVLARLIRVFGEHRRIAVLVDRQTAEAMQRYLELQPVLQNVVVHLSDGTKKGPPSALYCHSGNSAWSSTMGHGYFVGRPAAVR